MIPIRSNSYYIILGHHLWSKLVPEKGTKPNQQPHMLLQTLVTRWRYRAVLLSRSVLLVFSSCLSNLEIWPVLCWEETHINRGAVFDTTPELYLLLTSVSTAPTVRMNISWVHFCKTTDELQLHVQFKFLSFFYFSHWADALDMFLHQMRSRKHLGLVATNKNGNVLSPS